MLLFAGGPVKRSLRSARTPANVSQSFHKELNMYALAASAAGLGMLSLAHPAEGKIVYTPAHVIIGYGGVRSVDIDLNHDGVADFGLYMFANNCTSECVAALLVKGVPAGEDIVGKKVSSSSQAWALHPKAIVGPHAPFDGQGPLGDLMLGVYSLSRRRVWGDWNNVKNRYLGFKFSIHGKSHYGWARLNVRDRGHHITATLTGYAYETIPNKPIIAGATKGPEYDSVGQPNPEILPAPVPETASLGLLALGSPGLSIWRRKEDALRG